MSTSDADVFVQEVYHAGWTMYFRSERFEYDARPQHRRFLPMMDDGVMPVQVMLGALPDARHALPGRVPGQRQPRRAGPGGMFLHRNPQ